MRKINTYFCLLILLFAISCSNLLKNENNLKIDSSSIESIEKAIDSNHVPFLYGVNFDLDYPLHINKGGDRLFTMDSKYLRKSIEEKNANIIKEALKINYLNDKEHQSDPGYSYGYSVINSNVIVELLGFGWNDNGMVDEVDYYIFLISHDSLGNIIDNRIVAKSSNINDNLDFSEVCFQESDTFTIVEYKFAETKSSEYGKLPYKIELSPTKYAIDQRGIIRKEKIGKSYNISVDIKYNDFAESFIGKFLKEDYWIVK